MFRDRADELTMEIEVFKMSGGRRGVKAEGRRSRRGSLLSDYTQTKSEDGVQYSGVCPTGVQYQRVKPRGVLLLDTTVVLPARYAYIVVGRYVWARVWGTALLLYRPTAA